VCHEPSPGRLLNSGTARVHSSSHRASIVF
jgi:hypothetical protein